MTEISPYWLDVFDKLHSLGIGLASIGGVCSFAATFFMITAWDDDYPNIFMTKKWLFMWIIPFIGVLLMIFCPEIKK